MKTKRWIQTFSERGNGKSWNEL